MVHGILIRKEEKLTPRHNKTKCINIRDNKTVLKGSKGKQVILKRQEIG